MKRTRNVVAAEDKKAESLRWRKKLQHNEIESNTFFIAYRTFALIGTKSNKSINELLWSSFSFKKFCVGKPLAGMTWKWWPQPLKKANDQIKFSKRSKYRWLSWEIAKLLESTRVFLAVSLKIPIYCVIAQLFLTSFYSFLLSQ